MGVYNLPHYSTSFVGRARETAKITHQLSDPNCRLLTLVGPGGIGKTRLAVHIMLQLTKYRTIDVYFISLQPLNSHEHIVSTIAEVIGLQFNPGTDPKQQLLNHLRKQTITLVLDNFEHLLQGAKLLSEILYTAPQVLLLVTSRERLNLLEEWVFEVQELSYPSDETETDLEAYDAIQLFIQQARRVRADFDLTTLQQSIIRICRLVGGMPLGVELAASWVSTLSCVAIADEIARNLDILKTSMLNVESRHRNIRATFEPMWNYLSSEQQSVFKKLSVFRGGFTRDAAEHIAGASLDLLSELIHKSLVRVDANGRYDLHELLRQYAEERLHETLDELKSVRAKHSQYFMMFLSQREKKLEGREQKAGLEEIQRDIDNVREAWQWAVTTKHEINIGKACHALWFFYDTRSWYQEGEQAIRTAAETFGMNDLPTKEKSLVLGRLLAYYGSFCFSLDLPDKARALLEESLIILRRYDAGVEMGFALLRLSEVAMFMEGNLLVAQDYLQESLAIFRMVDHKWGIAYSLRWLGFAAFFLENYEHGKYLVQEALTIYRESGDQWGIAISLSVMGFCLLELGEAVEAKRIGQECVALCKEIGLHWAVVNGLLVIASATCTLSEYQEARQVLYEAVEMTFTRQFTIYILAVLEQTATLMMQLGLGRQATEILAFLLDYPIAPFLGRQRTIRLFNKFQERLSNDVFTDAVERGKRLDLKASIEVTLAFLQQSPTEVPQLLTNRELEILRLIAAGLSNREVARELVFSLGTVKWYLHHIYNKLGVSNRTQAVTYARKLKLLP